MKIVALAGGVGGAKLADGLAAVLPHGNLTVVVNVGDDFDHFGLRICPDLDTVCYTLAGIANPVTGWGRSGDSHIVLKETHRLGGPDWFGLGDLDLATHLERTRRLQMGEPLSKITATFCEIWGVSQSVLPVSDERISTMVQTKSDGELAFQDYFVRRRCEPEVLGFRFAGIEEAKPTPGLIEAISGSDAVVICPSNPWVSIAPILGVMEITEAIMQKPVLAVSPIVNGKVFKGPAAKMYREMGFEPSALSVANHYKAIIRGFIHAHEDTTECAVINQWGIIPYGTDIFMPNRDSRIRLASEILHIVEEIVEA